MYRYELKPEKEDRTANGGKPWPLGTIKSAPTSNHNLLHLGYRRVKFVPLCIVHGEVLVASSIRPANPKRLTIWFFIVKVCYHVHVFKVNWFWNLSAQV